MASDTVIQADRDLFISLRGFGADSDLARQVNAGWYCGDQVAEIAAHRRAAVAELVEALSEMLVYSNGRTNPAHAKASAILSRHQAGMKDKDHG